MMFSPRKQEEAFCSRHPSGGMEFGNFLSHLAHLKPKLLYAIYKA